MNIVKSPRFFVSANIFFRLTWLYLLLPLFFFALWWLRPQVGIPLLLLFILAMVSLWRAPSSLRWETSIWDVLGGMFLSGTWVVLSGVGGYAFQNWDHHWRNAVFRDLIRYSWPVCYAATSKGCVQMLVYYIGYWLPAAWVGKRGGWEVANAALFLWTWMGTLLVGAQVALRLRWPFWKSMLLLIFFSGMDALGVLLFSPVYPSLWPPIQHLEIWAGNLQYSSFTTALFWVFNQALPSWMALLLLLNGGEKLPLLFLWALMFFFAPFPALGVLPFLIAQLLDVGHSVHGFSFKRLLLSQFNLPNLVGLLTGMIAFSYFSVNIAAQNRTFQSIPPLHLLIFFLIEGGLLWMLLWKNRLRDPRWWIVGFLLMVLPLYKVGEGNDFVMRASIPALFFLMIWSGEELSFSMGWRRALLLLILGIGTLTPLYEINRSIYRSLSFYLSPPANAITQDLGPIRHLTLDAPPEADHPASLFADRIQSLVNVEDKLSKNFLANPQKSFFYRFLMREKKIR